MTLSNVNGDGEDKGRFPILFRGEVNVFTWTWWANWANREPRGPSAVLLVVGHRASKYNPSVVHDQIQMYCERG
jgi:hypothetical protein